MRKTLLSFYMALLLAALSPLLSAQATKETTPCSGGMKLARDIYSENGGWDLAFIDTSNVTVKESEMNAPDPAYSGVSRVQFSLRTHEFNYSTIYFDPCTRDAILKKSSMFVDRVVAYKKHGQVFAYVLSGALRELVDGEWQNCMCQTEISLYDPDGSGKFSHLIAYSPMPYMPDWVRGNVEKK